MQNSFYDADFRYLDDPKNTEFDFFDPLKRIRLGDHFLFSTGGNVTNRYMNEGNSRLGLRQNTYDLFRTRVYGDLWYQDAFRFYMEFISAHSLNHDLPPLPIDVNRADFLNLFVDIKLLEYEQKPFYARIGRQELLLGSQRLISPLEWGNTRRTFNGAKIFRTGEKWDLDLFWLQPVIANPNRLDSVDNNQNFAGIWATYRPKKGTFLDLYYLFLDNTNRVRQQGIERAPVSFSTVGSRLAGDEKGMLYDFEGGFQFGDRGASDLFAGFATAGLGYNYEKAAWNPTLWFYYDYASGTNNPNSGTFSTFNQLFPFGHYYLGWVDQVGRQNIHDFNVHLFLYPTKWITVWTQYHHFFLDQERDALYNVAGNALRRDATGRSGTRVGDEFDLILNFHLSKHADILTGYSKLFGDDFLRSTRGRTGAVNTDLFYLQYSYRW